MSFVIINKDRWIKKSSKKPKQFPELLNGAVTAKDGKKRPFPSIQMLSTEHGEIHSGVSYLPGFGPNNKDGCVIEVLGPVVEEVGGVQRLRVFDKKPSPKTTSMDTGKTNNGHSILSIKAVPILPTISWRLSMRPL